MKTFEERQKAFEAKYVHDEEIRFRALARRNRAVGLWAAGLLGITGDEAGLYLADLQALAFGANGTEVLKDRLVRDLEGLSDASMIEARMRSELSTAQENLSDESD